MIELYPTREEVIAAFIEDVRRRAAVEPVSWLIALFAEDTAGWRAIVIDPSGENDLDADIMWAANRMARIIGATAAAFVRDCPIRIGTVYVELKGAEHGDAYWLDETGGPDKADKNDNIFWIVPGGDPGEGWGWQDHDEIELDVEMLYPRPESGVLAR